MAFAPDHHGVLEVINTNVLEGCLALASAAPRLITMRTFAQHFSGKPAGLHIATIVRLKPMQTLSIVIASVKRALDIFAWRAAPCPEVPRISVLANTCWPSSCWSALARAEYAEALTLEVVVSVGLTFTLASVLC